MGTLMGALAGPLLTRWRDAAVGSAAALWLAGILIYLLTHSPSTSDCASRRPNEGLWCRIAVHHPIGPWLLLLAAIVLVLATAVLFSAAAPLVLAIADGGAWAHRGGAFESVAAALAKWHLRRRGSLTERVKKAKAQQPETVASDRRRAAANAGLRRYANGPELAPTAVANAFMASRNRTQTRYGLDLSVAWEPLVAVLPDAAQERLVAASAIILKRCQIIPVVITAMCLACWLTPVDGALWILLCLAGLAVAHRRMVRSVEAFVVLVETTVLVHRVLLYQACGFSAPTTADDEPAKGKVLSDYLWDWEVPSGITFTWPTGAEEATASPSSP